MTTSKDWLSIRCLLTAMATLTLTACGIDQGGNSSPPPSGAGSSTLLVSGPITGFGSVIVNGRTIDVGNATTLVDGNPGIEADLREGQVIRLIAQVDGNSVNALFIEFQRNVSGAVEAVDVPADTLTVLGKTIRTDAGTRFDIPGVTRLADLQVDDLVLVSGIPAAAGEVLATYIGAANVAEPFEISARITATDAPALTFELGALTVDYSQALLLELPLGIPQVGQIVQVKASTLANGVLTADQVRALPRLPGAFSSAATQFSTGELAAVGPGPASAPLSVSFIGFVSGENLPAAIAVDDVAVELDAATVVVGGAQTDLLAGRRIRVDGQVLNVGAVRATRITIF